MKGKAVPDGGVPDGKRPLYPADFAESDGPTTGHH